MGLRSEIRDPEKNLFRIPGQKSTGSRIRIRNTDNVLEYFFKITIFVFASEPGERDDVRRVPGERGEAGQEGQDQGRQQAQEEPQSS